MTWFKGRTVLELGQRGRTVEITKDPYVERDAVVMIDGYPTQHSSSRMRDGGTTVIVTPVGRIFIPSPFKWGKLPGGEWTSREAQEHAVKWPTLDNERLYHCEGVIVPKTDPRDGQPAGQPVPPNRLTMYWCDACGTIQKDRVCESCGRSGQHAHYQLTIYQRAAVGG